MLAQTRMTIELKVPSRKNLPFLPELAVGFCPFLTWYYDYIVIYVRI